MAPLVTCEAVVLLRHQVLLSRWMHAAALAQSMRSTKQRQMTEAGAEQAICCCVGRSEDSWGVRGEQLIPG